MTSKRPTPPPKDEFEKRLSELDQVSAELKHTMPLVWKSVYDGCLQAGFEKDLALELTKEWMRCEFRTYRINIEKG